MSVPSPTPEPSSSLPGVPPLRDAVPQPTGPDPAGGSPESTFEEQLPRPPRRQRSTRNQRLARPGDSPLAPLTAEQRLLILDAWRRGGLP